MRRSIWWAVLVTVVALSAASLVTPGMRGSATGELARLAGVTARLAGDAAGATSVAATHLAGRLRAARLDETVAALVRRASASAPGIPITGLGGAGVLAGLAAVALALVVLVVVAMRRSSRRAPYHAALRMIRRGTPAARIGRRTRLAQDAVRLIGRRA